MSWEDTYSEWVRNGPTSKIDNAEWWSKANKSWISRASDYIVAMSPDYGEPTAWFGVDSGIKLTEDGDEDMSKDDLPNSYTVSGDTIKVTCTHGCVTADPVVDQDDDGSLGSVLLSDVERSGRAAIIGFLPYYQAQLEALRDEQDKEFNELARELFRKLSGCTSMYHKPLIKDRKVV